MFSTKFGALNNLSGYRDQYMFQFSNSFHTLGKSFYTFVTPRPLVNPKMVAVNAFCARYLGIANSTMESQSSLSVLSGKIIAEGSMPLAMVYAGHQFGGFSPELGDGRGLLLGEIESSNVLYDIHLKGAGQTPYSRFGDGYAVLRSCIREFLASVAMRGLNIPTSDALCITTGDNPVQRETLEPAAMLTRVAKSHVRFGSFEYFFYSNQHEQLKVLADYVINRHYSHLNTLATTEKYTQMLQEISDATALMIGLWQAEGFAHGVMNTDNMSIIGETLDYGPYGFIETYQPGFICNHSDHQGRYAFDQQPNIGLWNLSALAHALSPLVPKEKARAVLMSYEEKLTLSFQTRMAKKLGLQSLERDKLPHLGELFILLEKGGVDYSRFMRALCYITSDRWADEIVKLTTSETQPELAQWLHRHLQIIKDTSKDLHAAEQQMLQNNPKFILRNYLAQNAIDAAYRGDYSEIAVLQNILRTPYDEHNEHAHLAKAPPAWASSLTVSCSS